MITSNLRTNQLSAAAYEWYLTYLAALDAKDLQQYEQFLADECTMYSNNDPPMVGKATIVQGLSQYWPSFGTLEHDLLNIYGTDAAFVLEALNHYTRTDGRALTLRAVAFTDRNAAGLVSGVRFYTDTSPLFT
ncbi:MAG: nuclear transport factor 2 family protein [Aphanocapsa lilacina HA4352-LM1]|jgi:ketosteroid isomerase-like protein|nr:nuclear transport factor 2 family protein [Aphanocapsa lilacina HA4352-LM1]